MTTGQSVLRPTPPFSIFLDPPLRLDINFVWTVTSLFGRWQPKHLRQCFIIFCLNFRFLNKVYQWRVNDVYISGRRCMTSKRWAYDIAYVTPVFQACNVYGTVNILNEIRRKNCVWWRQRNYRFRWSRLSILNFGRQAGNGHWALKGWSKK